MDFIGDGIGDGPLSPHEREIADRQRKEQVVKEYNAAKGNLGGVLGALAAIVLIEVLFFGIQFVFNANAQEAGNIIVIGLLGTFVGLIGVAMLWGAIEALLRQIITYIRTKNELKGWDDV